MPAPLEPQKNGGQAEQALGRSRGGFSTKIHVTVDGLGYPLRLHLTAGQRHDIIKAHDLTVDLAFDHLLADCSYGAQHFRDELLAKGTQPVIPSPKNAKAPHVYDAWRYRERHLIECLSAKSNIFVGSFLASTNWLDVISVFYNLPARLFGYDQMSTQPRDMGER